MFRGLLSVHSRYGLYARQVAQATLYTGGSDGFVTSAAAPIATEWSEPVLGRDFHPQLISALHGAGAIEMLRNPSPSSEARELQLCHLSIRVLYCDDGRKSTVLNAAHVG
jgi:hypothetical protein